MCFIFLKVNFTDFLSLKVGRTPLQRPSNHREHLSNYIATPWQPSRRPCPSAENVVDCVECRNRNEFSLDISFIVLGFWMFVPHILNAIRLWNLSLQAFTKNIDNTRHQFNQYFVSLSLFPSCCRLAVELWICPATSNSRWAFWLLSFFYLYLLTVCINDSWTLCVSRYHTNT